VERPHYQSFELMSLERKRWYKSFWMDEFLLRSGHL